MKLNHNRRHTEKRFAISIELYNLSRSMYYKCIAYRSCTVHYLLDESNGVKNKNLQGKVVKKNCPRTEIFRYLKCSNTRHTNGRNKYLGEINVFLLSINIKNIERNQF